MKGKIPVMTNLLFAVGMVLQSAAVSAQGDAAPLQDGFSRALIQEAYADLSPAMCVLRYSIEITNPSSGEVTRRSAYSLGLMVASDGLILGHGHLQIENRQPINIRVTVGEDDDAEYEAELLEKPDDINVTFLRIRSDEPLDFPYVHFASGDDLELGEPILLLGLMRESLDYARGIKIRRVGAILDEPRTTYALDSATGFGYIGAPALNDSGEVVGVVGFDMSSAEGGDIYTRSGHPLLYQSELFQRYIETPPGEQSEGTGKEDAWLGVFTQPLTDKLATYWKLPQDGGIVVSTVLPGSPADRAGLRSGDVILDFDGHVVTAKQDQDVVAFTKMVRESPLDEPLSIQLLREGEAMEIRLTLLPRPTSGRDAREIEDSLFGLTIREITTDARIVMNLSEDIQGVIIRRVKSGSPAALARIRPGFVVMSIDGQAVTSVDEYISAVEAVAESKPTEVRVFCRVGANTAFFRIQPRWEE